MAASPSGRRTAWTLTVTATIGDWKLDLMAKMIFQTLWTDKKAESDLAALKDELEQINAAGEESANSLNMAVIEAALNEMLDFSGPTIDEKCWTNSCAALPCWTIPISAGI